MSKPTVSASPRRHEGWGYFPLVLCINLKEREERFEEAKRELARVGIGQVSFYRSVRQPDRDKAIIDSHMACLQKIVESGVPYALLLEDDAIFDDGVGEHLPRVIDFLESGREWSLFHFGALIFKEVEYVTPEIVRGGLLTLHAVVIKREFAIRALAERRYLAKGSIDLFYSALLGDEDYGYVRPQLALQRATESDGSWDKRSLNKEGWLQNAMRFTALTFREKLRFTEFGWMERLRITNGMTAMKVIRFAMKKQLAKARKAGADVSGGAGQAGEFVEVALAEESLASR